jgi:hypothetical protein
LNENFLRSQHERVCESAREKNEEEAECGLPKDILVHGSNALEVVEHVVVCEQVVLHTLISLQLAHLGAQKIWTDVACEASGITSCG